MNDLYACGYNGSKCMKKQAMPGMYVVGAVYHVPHFVNGVSTL